MATVINRATREVRRSVNEPDFPQAAWIWNPSLPLCDPKYWVVDGDTVREMTIAEKDAAVATWQVEQVRALVTAIESYAAQWYPPEQLLQLRTEHARAVAEGKTNRAGYFAPWVAFSDLVLAEYKTRRDAVMAATTHDAVYAVSLDFSALDVQAPAVKASIADGLGVPD